MSTARYQPPTIPRVVLLLESSRASGRDLLRGVAQFLLPDQAAVLGADNDDLVCGFCNPPLSSVAIGFERAGKGMTPREFRHRRAPA